MEAIETNREPLSGSSFPESIRFLLDERGMDLDWLAMTMGVERSHLDRLTDGDKSPSSGTIELIANSLGVAPGYFLEYRRERVISALARDPERVNDLFLRSMSEAERELVDVSAFDNRGLREVLRQLMRDEDMTQGELAESIGLVPTEFSLVVNGRAEPPLDFAYSVAQAMGVQPEFLLAYRLDVVSEWLRDSSEQVTPLWLELTRGVELAPYEEWEIRRLPDPRDTSLVDLAKSLIEIVGVEGPVIGARAYAMRLRAAGLDAETRDLRTLLNRASYAATRAQALQTINESGQPTQKYLVLRLPGTPTVRVRERGSRALVEIPVSEVAAVVASTEAYRFGHSLDAVQNDVLATYRVTDPRLADLEHINRAINLKGGR